MGKAAKWGAWLLGACVVAVAAWFAINATDEALSEEARAALLVPPLPAPSRDNGYLDFVVLGAPEEVPTYEAALERMRALQDGTFAPPWGEFRSDPRIPRCPCLEAAAEPGLREVIDGQRTLLRRYREMRDKPRFVNVMEAKSFESALPNYQEMSTAARLVLLDAALRFHAGDRAGALRELEREAAFYRRMSSEPAVGLIDKMIAFAAQDRIALFVAELARRTPPGDASWRRLEALVHPLTPEELDVVPTLRRSIAEDLRWMQARRYPRAMLEGYAQWGEPAPWWLPLAPYLYRPHQSANRCAARSRIFLELARHPSAEFAAALEAARARAEALDPGRLARVVFNPVMWALPGWAHCDVSGYVARMHGRAGVQTLVRLQVKLRAGGIVKSDQVAAALAGPLGQAHADPFTGKPMRFDAQTGTLGFEAKLEHLSGAVREQRERYGRMALPL